MQIWLKMAIKITLFSLPGLVIVGVIVTYLVTAQKAPSQKNSALNSMPNPVTLTPPYSSYSSKVYQPPSIRPSSYIPPSPSGKSSSSSDPESDPSPLSSPTYPSRTSSGIHHPSHPPSCPPGMFKCSIKSNSLYHIRQRSRGFVCIDKKLVCDGNIDCAMGEDELDCEKDPEGEIEECYLCHGTSGVCIGKENLCDGIPDCPLEDDEKPENCRPGDKNGLSTDRQLSVPVNVGGSSEMTHGSQSSSFKSDQIGNANISIVNQRGLSSNDPEDRDRKLQAPNAGTGSVSGVGFNFQVENFVIYNSQVKMFNQDSENVALAGNKKGSFLDKIKEHQNPANISNGPPPGATTTEPVSGGASSTSAPQPITPPPALFKNLNDPDFVGEK